jgi:hypothetical protein
MKMPIRLGPWLVDTVNHEHDVAQGSLDLHGFSWRSHGKANTVMLLQAFGIYIPHHSSERASDSDGT